jgi:hypothetical protein
MRLHTILLMAGLFFVALLAWEADTARERLAAVEEWQAMRSHIPEMPSWIGFRDSWKCETCHDGTGALVFNSTNEVCPRHFR